MSQNLAARWQFGILDLHPGAGPGTALNPAQDGRNRAFRARGNLGFPIYENLEFRGGEPLYENLEFRGGGSPSSAKIRNRLAVVLSGTCEGRPQFCGPPFLVAAWKDMRLLSR